MISVTVLSSHVRSVDLFFSSDVSAIAAYETLVARDRGENDFEIEVVDDYGARAMFNRDEVVTIIMNPGHHPWEGPKK